MKIFLIISISIIILIQLIPITKTNPPVDAHIALHAPKDIQTILETACYDCHSNETKWPSYSKIAPLSWSISSHVIDGREALNFSQWKTIDPSIKKKRVKRAIKTINNFMMPLPSYLWLHDEAKLTAQQREVLTNWFKNELKNLTN